MSAQQSQFTIISIENNGSDASYFSEQQFELNGSPERFLSEQISAENFRLRTSYQDYASGFHVAGDKTLLIILSGTLRIQLKNGESKDFAKGEMFIANDFLKKDIEFNDELHGHRAEVIGEEELKALHLKLEKRSN